MAFKCRRSHVSGVSVITIMTAALIFLNHVQMSVHTSSLASHTTRHATPATVASDVPLRCPDDMTLNVSQYSDVQHQSDYVIGSGKYTDQILILTPISNSVDRLANYFKLLCSLNYPHHLISVALGEDTSTDKTYEIASSVAKRMSPYFREIQVFHFDEQMKHVPVYSRHDPNFQLERRTHLAHARNQLLMRGLRDEDWVLWVDSDVAYVPPDLIQHLLSAKGDVVVPSCMYKNEFGASMVYDKNTWRETSESIAYLKDQPPTYLMLEGYGPTKRQYLPSLAHEGTVVDIDGVGGCTLLVRANCHRKGLNFPAFVFDNHIETEGLAKMASRMKFSVKGLPLVNVFHA